MAQHQSRHRAQSRASTASIHSISTQPNLDSQSHLAHHAAFPEQWITDHGQARDIAAVQQMSAGDMILRPASQLQAQQPFSNNSSMHSTVGSMSYPHQQQSLQHAVPVDSFGANASFTDGDSQMLDRDEGDEVESVSVVAPQAGSKTGSSRTSANNELEMRQLFKANKHRSLGDVAMELHGNERGPNSERARQIFAMLWISQVCVKGKGSVPRGRVYAFYATRCGTERITILNPASFGKLVRVLFPGLKTRRLGVRGESKYHYVNFSLHDDQPELRSPSVQPALAFPDSAPFAQSFNGPLSQSPALNPERSALPSPMLVHQSDSQAGARTLAGGSRSYSLYNQPDVTALDQLQSANSKTKLRLAFLTEADEPSVVTITLPRIDDFLPPGTDLDAATSLTACYRSHCTSLIECIRYCKDKTFFHTYTSLQGIMTMPVQKLFADPSIAPWIEECDFMVYQRMMQIISVLTLQVIPKQVLDALRNISERLVSHIHTVFQGQPRHVVQAREAPATIFAALIDRALRVNLTAHAAASMLTNSDNRDLMYSDWIMTVRIRKVAECVPARGMDDLVKLFLYEIRDLISPVNVAWDIEVLTLYGDVAQSKGQIGQMKQASDSAKAKDKGVLDPWVAFLRSLPGRFPYASPADIVRCVQLVGTAVMRDLTMAQSKSFGVWWVTKCWIDEMIGFLAEYGGFMTSKNSLSAVSDAPKQSGHYHGVSQQGLRITNGNDGSNMSHASLPQPDHVPFPQQFDANGQDSLHESANPDDSGIGIRTPEEDFPMGKFDFSQAGDHNAQSPGPEQAL
ncbi:RFX DNA-binding domain-containing protein [Annulohypoxylon bovei var. microspora]|nr:RFX DNA-binding domain-containing protein [Annulohypoxylon bovei var. microspora]